MNGPKLDTRELDRIAAKMGTNTREVIGGLAYEVRDLAKEFAAVDTGAMKNSIFAEIEESGPIVAIVGTPEEINYAPFVELGTYKMGAQPFLMPALQMVVHKLNQGITWMELFE